MEVTKKFERICLSCLENGPPDAEVERQSMIDSGKIEENGPDEFCSDDDGEFINDLSQNSTFGEVTACDDV